MTNWVEASLGKQWVYKENFKFDGFTKIMVQ